MAGMIVVADTSPLNYLILLGHPEVLQEIYGRVLVPNAVLIEMRHPEAPKEVRLWASAPPDWIEQVQVQRLDATLAMELGAGEREAISLALEVRADVLLIDERAGRVEAEARHIPVAGTLAVLVQASLRGYFDFPEVVGRLRRFGFRVSTEVEAVMLARYEAARRSSE
jgi:predicted nucleic acid-binding protein